MNDDCVLFLEPRGAVLEVIRAAKARGLGVVALTTDPRMIAHAPALYASGREAIDQIIEVESWADPDALLGTVARSLGPSRVRGVFTGAEPAIVAAAALRRAHGLPAPPPGALERVLDKSALRRRLRELGLSRLRNVAGAEADGWTRWEMDGPAYFKPVHGAFSAYVARCETLDDLRAARAAWQRGGTEPGILEKYIRSRPEYHLEQAFEGEMLSVEGLSRHGRFACLGLSSRVRFADNPVVEMGLGFPYEHPREDAIIDFVRRCHEALELTDGPTHTELIVNPEGAMEIIDLNARFVGGNVLKLIDLTCDAPVERALVAYAVGEPVELPRPVASRYAFLQAVLPPRGVGTFESIEFPDAPEIAFTVVAASKGAALRGTERQSDHLACFAVVMPTFESAVETARTLARRIRVNGSHPVVC